MLSLFFNPLVSTNIAVLVLVLGMEPVDGDTLNFGVWLLWGAKESTNSRGEARVLQIHFSKRSITILSKGKSEHEIPFDEIIKVSGIFI